MPNVLDSFFITLGFDGKGLSKGAKQAQKDVSSLKDITEETGESLKKTGKNGADAFAAFRREALGALALFTGGRSLMGFTKDITNANTALGNLSCQLDIAPQKLTPWHIAAPSERVPPEGSDAFLFNILPQGEEQKHQDAPPFPPRTPAHPPAHDVIDEPINPKGHVRPILEGVPPPLASPSYGTPQRREPLLAEWDRLKATSSHVMGQAYREIEPTIKNLTNALSHLEKAHLTPPPQKDDAATAALSSLSALLSARAFLTAFSSHKGGALGAGSTPSPPYLPLHGGGENPQRPKPEKSPPSPLFDMGDGGKKNRPVRQEEGGPLKLSPSLNVGVKATHTPFKNQAYHHDLETLKALLRTYTLQGTPRTDVLSPTALATLTGAFTRPHKEGDHYERVLQYLARATQAVPPRPAHTTTHTTTTHAPVVNIAIYGAGKNAHDIAHETSHAVHMALSQDMTRNNRTRIM